MCFILRDEGDRVSGKLARKRSPEKLTKLKRPLPEPIKAVNSCWEKRDS